MSGVDNAAYLPEVILPDTMLAPIKCLEWKDTLDRCHSGRNMIKASYPTLDSACTFAEKSPKFLEKSVYRSYLHHA